MGTNEDYLTLSRELRSRDMKLIMDIVLNHIGSNHWWMDDLPFDDWLNHDESFLTNYRAGVVADPYHSDYDRKKMVEGWFVSTMPDLNQHNPFLALYLKQMAVWWIEYAELHGFRVDTQPYVFEDFIPQWSEYIKKEYPNFTILGESWLQKIGLTSYFEGKDNPEGEYNSKTDVVTDFPMYFALSKALLEEQSWTEGIIRLYYILSQDFLYSDPMNNLIFMDNHDLSRIYTTLEMDLNKLKMATTFIMTTRGIPMFYYGTEALSFGNEHDGHGFIRKDMPGGWLGDHEDIFKQKNLTNEQKDYFSFFTKLANYRKSNPDLATAKLTHFIPENNTYVYFRYSTSNTWMIIINNDDDTVEIDKMKYKEMINGYQIGKDVMSDMEFSLEKSILVNPQTSIILELK